MNARKEALRELIGAVSRLRKCAIALEFSEDEADRVIAMRVMRSIRDIEGIGREHLGGDE